MKGRIEIKPGRGGSPHTHAEYNVAKFPFTELTPSLGPPAPAVYDRCKGVLDALTPHPRDAVLMLLVVHYGNVVRVS